MGNAPVKIPHRALDIAPSVIGSKATCFLLFLPCQPHYAPTYIQQSSRYMSDTKRVVFPLPDMAIFVNLYYHNRRGFDE
jgi:hypothetical protein